MKFECFKEIQLFCQFRKVLILLKQNSLSRLYYFSLKEENGK